METGMACIFFVPGLISGLLAVRTCILSVWCIGTSIKFNSQHACMCMYQQTLPTSTYTANCRFKNATFAYLSLTRSSLCLKITWISASINIYTFNLCLNWLLFIKTSVITFLNLLPSDNFSFSSANAGYKIIYHTYTQQCSIIMPMYFICFEIKQVSLSMFHH